MDYENNDLGRNELAEEQFQPELEQTISQHVENPPLVVIYKFSIIFGIKIFFFNKIYFLFWFRSKKFQSILKNERKSLTCNECLMSLYGPLIDNSMRQNRMDHHAE